MGQKKVIWGMCLTWFTHEICLEWTVCYLVISQFVVISQLFFFWMQKELTTQLFHHLQNPMLLVCLCSPQFLIYTLTCFTAYKNNQKECLFILHLQSFKDCKNLLLSLGYSWSGPREWNWLYQVTAWEVCATVKQWHLLDYFITAHRISVRTGK